MCAHYLKISLYININMTIFTGETINNYLRVNIYCLSHVCEILIELSLYKKKTCCKERMPNASGVSAQCLV